METNESISQIVELLNKADNLSSKQKKAFQQVSRDYNKSIEKEATKQIAELLKETDPETKARMEGKGLKQRDDGHWVKDPNAGDDSSEATESKKEPSGYTHGHRGAIVDSYETTIVDGELAYTGNPKKSTGSLAEAHKAVADVAHEGYENLSTEARELHITGDSMPELSNRRDSIIRNLKRKLDKGTYETDKAVKLAGYLIDDANKQYKKDFGHSFSTAQRKEVATQWIKEFEGEVAAGNYD